MVVTQEINIFSSHATEHTDYKELKSGLYYTLTKNKRHLRLVVLEKGGPFLWVNNYGGNDKNGSLMWLVDESLESNQKDLRLNWLPATGEKIVIEG